MIYKRFIYIYILHVSLSLYGGGVEVAQAGLIVVGLFD